MEDLSLRDGQSQRKPMKHQSFSERRYYASRLPTPETSRSSNEALDDGSPRRLESSTLQDDRMTSDSATGVYGRPSSVFAARRDSRYFSAPQSPPCCVEDAQRPSLPPIKTVLGDEMSSPPKTPSPCGYSLQPSPREPTLLAATYKPPSLYPNKKQKTETSFTPSHGYVAAGCLTPPFPSSSSFAARDREMLTRRSSVFASMSTPRDRFDTHPTSTCPSVDMHASSSPSWNAPTSSSMQSAYGPTYHPHTTSRSLTHQPIFSGLIGAPQDPYRRSGPDDAVHYSTRPVSRRLSSSSYSSAYPQRSHHRDGSIQASMVGGLRTPLAPRDIGIDSCDSVRYGSLDALAPRLGSDADMMPYRNHSGAFFMPTHYEHHGKARKRSNLPKQSTEIMKTWFDQNIANPYPSEEQKSAFASATGISMTQVSNWFINLRRRCPELRDKRERTRTGSRDGDY